MSLGIDGTCAFCGKTFRMKRLKQRFCGRPCKYAYRHANEARIMEIARRVAAGAENVCPHCGKSTTEAGPRFSSPPPAQA